MATSYKTPGVYVEEIAKFPPSVAEVETAIPAFIGFTAQAKKIIDGDLKEKPTRITSLLEYEQYFGQGPDFIPGNIELNDNNMPVADNCTLTNSKFLLYDSIRLFYDNGGGACYIVSVGTFGETEATLFADNTRFIKGLDALKKYDEPTMIVFPEAVGLSTDSLGALQQAALKQCAELGDRFT
ncbi:MAG TPA: phage tail sheath family protein, partial [Bacteroidales bacterium]|nr:phage tail sheath family protein [Bacteroidales bacterium]